jgi:hypothetical protein
MDLNDLEIFESLKSANNRKQIFKSNQKIGSGLSTNQGGASDSFFFMTEDNRFIVKTISAQEKNVMLKLLETILDKNY